jgi:hypothetical protein
MNMYDIRNEVKVFGKGLKLAATLLIAVLLWLTGAPAFLHTAKAAALLLVSDTLTDSDLSVVSGHTFRFTIQTALNDAGGADTITVRLDPDSSAFQINLLDVSDFVGETGVTVVSACTGGPTNEFTLATTTESFTLTICANDTVATSTAIMLPVLGASQIINPGVAQSYVIRITTLNQGVAILDAGDTRVAIIDDVVVTAAVNTSFTFQIFGVAAGTAINGVTTSTSTTPTTIEFGILDPSTGASTTAGQRLTVATNAANGFTVTVKENQNLTSSTGADIDVFRDGAGSPPESWANPANTFGSENTYGHFGITSDDATLSGGDIFGTALFSGQFASTSLPVFYHTGPADGVTANIGETYVAFKIAITALQEAGNDYTNTLTYVATPVF